MTEGPLLAGRYRRVSGLGRGAMGEVWLADDLLLGRRVAIKVLRPGQPNGPDREAVARMVREARIAAQLDHPSAVRVHDLIDVDGVPHVIMEYVPGRTLAEWIRAAGRVPVAEVVRIGAQLAAALSAAHRRGIVHRDVKPANILIAAEGDAKLADFGIARIGGDPSLTQTGLIIGTPAYLAPEVARGAPPSPASDIWSLGVTLYAAVEGRPPFGRTSDNTLAVLSRVLTEPIPEPRNAGALQPLLAATLQRDPQQRISAGQAVDLLRRIAEVGRGEAPTQVRPARVVEPSTFRREPIVPETAVLPRAAPARHPTRTIVIGCAAVVAAALAGLIGWATLTGADTPARTSSPPPTSLQAARPVHDSTAPSTSPPSSPASAVSSAPAPTPIADPMTATNMRTFVTSYYALIPDDLSTAWTMLGPGLQAQGFAAYRHWWTQFDRVVVTPLSADPAAQTVRIRLTVHRATTGSTVTDTEELTLIPTSDGRGLLIDGDAVG